MIMGSVKRFEISVDADGVLFLPAEVCARMGLENGGKLSLTESEFGLKLTHFPENKTSADPILGNL
jgi:bifunctional DNA-binding transcriptional regulator/antitoxin component of YhaV-PrlF toxin-antitoxin module